MTDSTTDNRTTERVDHPPRVRKAIDELMRKKDVTSNRTTELREKLTERGIEWRSGLEGVTFVGDWCFVEYDNGKLAATCEHVLTPEQAIAATVGNGTLTVEQVEKAISDCCTYASYDGCTYYASGIRLQAIADELNAELDKGDNGECYLVHEGKKYPAELDFGFLGMMPITITVGGFRYLAEVPNGE